MADENEKGEAKDFDLVSFNQKDLRVIRWASLRYLGQVKFQNFKKGCLSLD